ncbi:hypothetical protein GCM10010243_15820 [Streptomyces matensis]|nr:hypothetical protein GCM10010243_15820 [Streptomyces matensis]
MGGDRRGRGKRHGGSAEGEEQLAAAEGALVPRSHVGVSRVLVRLRWGTPADRTGRLVRALSNRASGPARGTDGRDRARARQRVRLVPNTS